MENELRNLNHMRDILDHMHKIGGEWYEEMVALKKENADLKKENARLGGLEKLITERINSLYANIDDKSKLVLDKISEVHTKDISDLQNEIVKTRNSISPLTEAKRFYDEKLDTLNKKQTELDNREKAISQDESNLRNKQGQFDDWQRNLEPRKNELDNREQSLNDREAELDSSNYRCSADDDSCNEESDTISDNQELKQPAPETSPTETNDNPPAPPQNNGQVKNESNLKEI